MKGEASITALRQETLRLGQTLEVRGWNYKEQLHKKNASTNGKDGKDDEKTKIGRLLKRGSLPGVTALVSQRSPGPVILRTTCEYMKQTQNRSCRHSSYLSDDREPIIYGH